MTVPTLTPLAADLDPIALRHRIETDQQAAKTKAALLVEQRRISQRIDYLERKAKRLPIGNAKRKTLTEIARLRKARLDIAEVLT